MKKISFRKYADRFSENQYWQKINRFARQVGIKAVYTSLLLFFAYNRKDTPGWARRIVLGSLGYLVAPIDALPDLTPILGYTDDLGVLSFGLVTVAAYVNDEVKEKARARLKKWFGDYDETELAAVDRQL